MNIRSYSKGTGYTVPNPNASNLPARLVVDSAACPHSLWTVSLARAGMSYMNRGELVRLLVLNAISDDYENVDQVILRYVVEQLAKLGMAIERSEIVIALGGLIQDGLAKAYLLSGTEPYSTEFRGMPPLDVVEENFKTYFNITKKGRDLLLADKTDWPFDDEGNLRR
jgi:hypothetical protein